MFPYTGSKDSDQIGQKPRLAHMPFCWSCHEAVHFYSPGCISAKDMAECFSLKI